MPRSKAEVRWAHSVAQGDIEGDKAYAAEVIDKMHGKKMSSLPEHAGGGSKSKPRGRLTSHAR